MVDAAAKAMETMDEIAVKTRMVEAILISKGIMHEEGMAKSKGVK
jgi:hypothetical protein